MSGTGGTPGPGYSVTPVDTSGVVGDPDGADVGAGKSTQYKAGNADTSNAGSGSRAVEPGSPETTPVDTSGTDSENPAGDHHPVSTAMSGTRSTLNPGGGAGIAEANPAYRAPSGPVAASSKDTTLTDIQPGSGPNVVPSSHNMTETQDIYRIGETGTTTGPLPVAPAKPTVATGPRVVTVTWAAVANPAGDPVLEYVIESDRGGRWVAPKNATSKRVDWTDPSLTYKFRVAARNKGGIGPFSPFSDPVRAYNPGSGDVLEPDGLDPANVVNGVYLPDGTVKGGTGGTNNAPVLGAVTPGAAASKTVTVNWTAPTVGDAPTSYVVKASTGQEFTSAAGTTSKACVFAAAGASVTFTVQAVNAKGSGAVSAPSAPVTVP